MTYLPSVDVILIASAIILVAGVLQVSVGMGFGMIASPLIALLDPHLVPVPIMLLGILVALFGAWSERENILPEHLQMGIGGRVVGMSCAVIGLALLANRDAFILVFGILVLIAVLLTASGLQMKLTRTSLFGMSIVSGFMGTFTSVGAPPMAIIFNREKPELVRPTLNAFFGIGSALSLLGLGLTGWLRVSDFVVAFTFLPALVVGMALSHRLRFSSTLWLGRFLLLLSGVAACGLIVRGVSAFGH